MEPTTSDVSAASSPATFEVPTESGARAEWFKSGKLPESSNTEDSATSEETPAEGESPKGKTAPASETGKKTQEKGQQQRSAAAGRLNELLDDIKRAGLTPEELKTFKRQAQQTEQKQTAEPPKAASEQTGKPADLAEPVPPKEEDFKTFDEFRAAERKYYRELAVFESKKAVDAYKGEQQQNQAIAATNGKIADAVKRYGDEADSVIRTASKELFDVSDGKVSFKIPPAVVQLLDQSPVWADLMYTLGGDKAELQSFITLSQTDPGAAIRKLVLMENLVQQELKGGKAAATEESDAAAATAGERDASGKFKKATPEKKESNAPPPPREVSGRATAPPDEVASAVKDGDFRKFHEAQNRRDLNRR